MFEFVLDMNNYETRKVDRYENDSLFVSTCMVSDGSQPYETAVAHDDYNEGKIIIVEAYDTREDAKHGHDKWVKTMTSAALPNELIDCANSKIQQDFGGKETFKRVVKR